MINAFLSINMTRHRHNWVISIVFSLGGLASSSPSDTRRIAGTAISLFDSNPMSLGAHHVQSQRFLSNTWPGLHPDDPSGIDPPLRSLVEALAEGTTTLMDYIDSTRPEAQSLLTWVAAFRHVN